MSSEAFPLTSHRLHGADGGRLLCNPEEPAKLRGLLRARRCKQLLCGRRERSPPRLCTTSELQSPADPWAFFFLLI